MDSSDPTILSTLDDGEHAFKHRTISTMLAPGVMRNVEQQILPYIATFVDRLGESDHDIQDLCNWLSFDIISDLLYGESFNLLQLPELRWLPEAYTAMSRWIMTCMVQPKVKLLIYLYRIVPVFQSIINLGKWTKQRSFTRCAAGAPRDDFFTLFQQAESKHTNHSYTNKGMWTESVLLLAAGSDTTSTTMGALFFHLFRNRDALNKLTSTLRATFEHESEIVSGPELANCVYLHACVREAMRLVPAVPNLSPRVVRSHELVIDGCHVPQKTHVGVSLYSLNRDPKVFEEAEDYLPERWLSTDGQRLNLELFKSFGVGPRACVGMNLALLELTLVVARTLFRYDVTSPPERVSPNGRSESEEDYCQFTFDAWAVAGARRSQVNTSCFVERASR
ncbi:hypothetical protein N7448_011362 [Penicillium atrosanguineum]|nr:hypothetical protein N7448_011362 [Penicillium atrosanguineum]